MSRLLLTLAALALGGQALAQGSLAVKVGNPLRKVLLDTLRLKVEKDFGQKVTFEVGTLNSNSEWAFFGGTALRPNGKPVDLKTTHYKSEMNAMDGPTVYALLRKKGKAWSIVKYMVGPTDVGYANWDELTGAPAAVIGLKK
jgi:hypothetical protein